MKKILYPCILLLLWVFVGCSDSSDDDNSNFTANRQQVGSSARDLLTQENFDRLILDIVYVEGFRPSDTTIDNLVSFINNRTHKPGGIEIEYTVVGSTGLEEFDIQEIANIEVRERTFYNDGTTMAIYIYFADAPSENSTGNSLVLGSAYFNTSIVIYEESVRELADRRAGLSYNTVSTAVIEHEFAHLLGLVDLGTPLQSDHLDAENGNHCNVDGCLMNANIEFITPDALGDDEVPELDPACLEDLRANGGK